MSPAWKTGAVASVGHSSFWRAWPFASPLSSQPRSVTCCGAGSALLGGLFTAWLIARKTSDPLVLVGGAVLVTVASLATLVLAIYLVFAIAGAGN